MLVCARPLGFVVRCSSVRNACAGPFVGRAPSALADRSYTCPQLVDPQQHGVVRFEHVRVYRTLVQDQDPVVFPGAWDVVCGCSQSRSMWRFPPHVGVRGVDVLMLVRTVNYRPQGARDTLELRQLHEWSACHNNQLYFMEAWLGWSVLDASHHTVGEYARAAMRHYGMSAHGSDMGSEQKVELVANNVVARTHGCADHRVMTYEWARAMRSSITHMHMRDMSGLCIPKVTSQRRKQLIECAAETMLHHYVCSSVDYARKQGVCVRMCAVDYWGAGIVSAVLAYVGHAWNVYASACAHSAHARMAELLSSQFTTAERMHALLAMFCASPLVFVDAHLARRMRVHHEQHARGPQYASDDLLYALWTFTRRQRGAYEYSPNGEHMEHLSRALHAHMGLVRDEQFTLLLMWINECLACDQCRQHAYDPLNAHALDSERARAWRLVHHTQGVRMSVLQCDDFATDAGRVAAAWLSRPAQDDVHVLVPNSDTLLNVCTTLYPRMVYNNANYLDQVDVRQQCVRVLLMFGHLWSLDAVEKLCVDAHTRGCQQIHVHIMYAIADERNLCWFAHDELHRRMLKECARNPERVQRISLPVQSVEQQQRPQSSSAWALLHIYRASMSISALHESHPWSCVCNAQTHEQRSVMHAPFTSALVTQLASCICAPRQAVCESSMDCMVLSALGMDDTMPSAIGVARLVSIHTQERADRFRIAIHPDHAVRTLPLLFNRKDGRSYALHWRKHMLLCESDASVSLCLCNTPFARLYKCHELAWVMPQEDRDAQLCVQDDRLGCEILGCHAHEPGTHARSMMLRMAVHLTLRIDANEWRDYALRHSQRAQWCANKNVTNSNMLSNEQKSVLLEEGGAVWLPHVREYRGAPLRCVLLLVSSRTHAYDLMRACLHSYDQLVFMCVENLLTRPTADIQPHAMQLSSTLSRALQNMCARSHKRAAPVEKRRARTASCTAKRMMFTSDSKDVLIQPN